MYEGRCKRGKKKYLADSLVISVEGCTFAAETIEDAP